MKPAGKKYKFINSETGYVIFYHTLSPEIADDKIKPELEKVKIHVAVKNGIFVGTVFWEEIKDDDKNAADPKN